MFITAGSITLRVPAAINACRPRGGAMADSGSAGTIVDLHTTDAQLTLARRFRAESSTAFDCCSRAVPAREPQVLG